EREEERLALSLSFFPAQIITEFEERALAHFEYFRLCLSAHYLTCGTPVPTDVDHQIRYKLWAENLPTSIALEMARLVLESQKWPFQMVSDRHVYGAKGSPWENTLLSGHHGEWFSVATAAYC